MALARDAERVGCEGIMALPAYVYVSDWYETRAHYSAVIGATGLSCMLYNNPIAYRTDVTPVQLAELCVMHENLHATKESSGDVRRVTALKETLGDRLQIFAGMDDMIVEALPMGATGWIAGLVQDEVGRGSAVVRPPRLELVGKERDDVLAVIRRQLALRADVMASLAHA